MSDIHHYPIKASGVPFSSIQFYFSVIVNHIICRMFSGIGNDRSRKLIDTLTGHMDICATDVVGVSIR